MYSWPKVYIYTLHFCQNTPSRSEYYCIRFEPCVNVFGSVRILKCTDEYEYRVLATATTFQFIEYRLILFDTRITRPIILFFSLSLSLNTCTGIASAYLRSNCSGEYTRRTRLPVRIRYEYPWSIDARTVVLDSH